MGSCLAETSPSKVPVLGNHFQEWRMHTSDLWPALEVIEVFLLRQVDTESKALMKNGRFPREAVAKPRAKIYP